MAGPTRRKMATPMIPEPNHDAPPDNPLGFIARPTPYLRASVERQRTKLVPAEFLEMIATIRSVFDKYTAKLEGVNAGADRARALHQLLDQALQSAAHIPVSCRKGCSGCCHYEIEITQDEAALLAAVVWGGVDVDYDRLAKQAARERKSAEWSNILRPENRCVFLDTDGACRVYEHRPSACRRHLVTSPAEACSTPGQPVAPVEVLLAEILLSAALSLEGVTYASLSKMLLAACRTFNGRD